MTAGPLEEMTLIAAVGRNGVIGRDGGLPWSLPDDLKYFKKSTLGHALIMGRGTYESLPVALPGRILIVVSRTMAAPPEGVTVCRDLDAALAAAAEAGDRRPLVGGGASIFREALPKATRLNLTAVETDAVGDTFFPDVDWGRWRLASETDHPADARHAQAFRFTVWERADHLAARIETASKT